MNGKFLADELTGVHRVGAELIRNCHQLLTEDPGIAPGLAMELWIPRKGREKAAALGVPYRIVAPLEGVAWGQITLPLRARGCMILSLGNVGPVLARNAVTMIQDAQIHSTPKSYGLLFRAWYRFHQPIAGRRHRRILTVSEFSRRQLAHYGVVSPEKVSVIHNGADHVLRDRPDHAVVARLGLAPGRYAMALANVQPHKNIGLLLEAFADPSMRDLTLVLFGAAGAESFAEAGLPVPPNVRFTGRLRDEELWGLYRNALCLAFPSLTEGFGLPPLEAMMLGCPVVAAPAGALPESCGDAPIYADPYNAVPWREAILSLTADETLRRAMIDRGHEWASRFSWKGAAIRLIALLAAL